MFNIVYYVLVIVIIIAGGSGTRLWPLSTPDYPKHLLKINGDSKSLLQQTYDRATILSQNIYVVTENGHVNEVMQQLPDLPEDNVVCEPVRRGTANCLIAALQKLEGKCDPDEPIASMHADHYIRDLAGFSNSFNLAKYISIQQNEIVLLGVEPDFPSTAFGYIEKGELLEDQSFAYKVKSFKEKPDFDAARSYLHSGNYLWNCGYFVGSLNTFKKSMEQYAPELYLNYKKLAEVSEEEYRQVYSDFENIAIDYALIEKVPSLIVVPASFDWMDLGSFSDLSTAIGGDEQGNSVSGNTEIEEVNNSLIQNYEEKPLAVIGLDNVVVINNKNGILVLRKDLAQRVGDMSKKFKKES
jgi:mannose-1-phosphate guanylyltransferase/mannose-6-phosphate isomerase